MIPWYYIVIVSAVVLLFLLWKEWTRQKKNWLFFRLLASVVAVLSLLFMAYPYQPTTTDTATKQIILLTDGFNADSLTRFKQPDPKIPLYSANRSIVHTNKKYAINFIPDLASFAKKHANDTIHIFGNGFTKQELNQLNNHPVIFHAAKSSPVIKTANWKQNVKTGELLTVQGQYENNSSQEIKILLQTFNTNVDSVIIPANTHSDFELKTIPKNAGKAVYSFLALSGKDTLQKEPVPVDVETNEPFNVLILSSSPDFENTFLKNYLSQRGYAITVRTAISKNKSAEQFLNTDATKTNNLSLSYIDKFDLLMADDEALAALNNTGLNAISKAIEENGIGLILRLTDKKNTPAFYSKFFPVYSSPQDKKPFTSIYSLLGDSTGYKLKLEEPVYLRYQPGAQSLLQDAKSNIFASAAVYGQGKIIATTLNNTYTLALAGDKTSYQSLWSLLLEKAARKKTEAETWAHFPDLSFVNEPVTVKIETSNSPLTSVNIGESTVILRQDSILPYQQQGIYWPVESSWQKGNWYAYNAGDWAKTIDHQRIIETKQYAAAHSTSLSINQGISASLWKKYLPLFLLILFFISVGFLWIEQKLFF